MSGGARMHEQSGSVMTLVLTSVTKSQTNSEMCAGAAFTLHSLSILANIFNTLATRWPFK